MNAITDATPEVFHGRLAVHDARVRCYGLGVDGAGVLKCLPLLGDSPGRFGKAEVSVAEARDALLSNAIRGEFRGVEDGGHALGGKVVGDNLEERRFAGSGCRSDYGQDSGYDASDELVERGEAAYMSHGLTPVHFLDIGLELIGFDVE